MIKPRLVLCSGANVPERDPLAEGRRVIRLDTFDPEPNAHLRLENVTDAFARLMPDRLVDLLELATYVYTADCEASRERAWMDDKATEPWARDFHFVMPVRDLEFWNDAKVHAALTSALSFLSSDTFGFTFQRLEHGRPVDGYLQIEDVEDSPFYGVQRVVMFSGGLDALAGAVEMAQAGEKLVLVSHRPAPQINKRQRELFELLRGRFDVPMMHIPVWVNKSGYDRESTQRTRSFLFGALGAAVASVLNAGGVRFYENGVISLNWPLADEVLQSRASRTTHPESLVRLQRFLQLVTGTDEFAIDNPFVFNTKAEVVARLAQNSAEDLIARTCSCTHTMFQPRNQRHCGTCGQCIDRRIAILAAGQEGHDCEGDYASDVFMGPRKTGYQHNVAVNYARFASDLNGMGEDEIGRTYNLELTRAARCFDRQGEAAEAFIDLHRRHGESVCGVLAERVEAHAQSFVDGTLDSSSLLAMVGRGEHLEAPHEVSLEPVVAAPEAGNVFRRELDWWTVVFDGKLIRLKDTKGVRCIAFLLQHPDKEFHVLRLTHEVDGAPLPAPNETYSDMSEEALADEGLFLSGARGGETKDDEDDADLRQGLRKAQAALKSAEIRQDGAAIAKARREIEWHRRALTGERGKAGRRPPAGDSSEKARSAVSQAIGRVLDKIKPDHLSLYEHLDGRIERGTFLCYRAAPGINWAF